MILQLNFNRIRQHSGLLEQERREVQILLSLWEQSPALAAGDPGAVRQMDALRQMDFRIQQRIRLLEQIVEDYSQVKATNLDSLLSARDTLDSLKQEGRLNHG